MTSLIKNQFENMDYIPKNESYKIFKDWLHTHNSKFSSFIDNVWTPHSDSCFKLHNPTTLEFYADVTVGDYKVVQEGYEKSRTALSTWQGLSAEKKSSYLMKISENVKKNGELFALTEALPSGKLVSRTKSVDVPDLIQSLKYYASRLLLSPITMEIKNGVACVISEYNEPTLSASWKIGSSLASGSVILLLVKKEICLSSLLFAELCKLSGLPSGIFNVVPISDPVEDIFLKCEDKISSSSLATEIPFEFKLSARPTAIVYEDSDLYAAVDGILQMLFYADNRSERSGCQVLIQSSIQAKFERLLEEKFGSVVVGTNISKCDMTCLVTSDQKSLLLSCIEEAKSQNFKVVQTCKNLPNDPPVFSPTLICSIPTTSKLLEKIGAGPIVLTVPFRTVKESISIFNQNHSESDVSVWTSSLGLEVSHQLEASTIWVNTQNVFSVPDRNMCALETAINNFLEFSKVECLKEEWPMKDSHTKKPATSDVTKLKTDSRIKLDFDLHIGGSYKKPLGGGYTIAHSSKGVPYAYVAESEPVDFKTAVSSATGAYSKWRSLSNLEKASILLKAASILKDKQKELLTVLCEFGGNSEVAVKEIDSSIALLKFFGHTCATFNGISPEMKDNYKVLTEFLPVGVIGIECPDEKFLLPFLYLVVPAIAFGNAVVVSPSGVCPVPALKMCEIFYQAGLQGGVLNVVTGNRSSFVKEMCQNFNINALWYATNHVHNCSRGKTNGMSMFNCGDFNLATVSKLMPQSVRTKITYFPMGDVFYN